MFTEHSEHTLFDFDGEIARVEAETYDEFHLATQVVNALVKAVKASRVYDPDHQLYHDLQQHLIAQFACYFSHHVSLTLQISELEFSLQDRTVYRCDDVKTSVPFLFFRDGIRQLRLLQGITEEEVLGILAVLHQSDQVNRREDDLVTLFWERDFTHIDCIAEDNFLDASEVVTIATPEEFRAHRPSAPPAHEIDILLGKDIAGSDGIALTHLASLLANKELYRLTSEDMLALQREVQAEIPPTATCALAPLLLDLLPHVTGIEGHRRAMTQLTQTLHEIFNLGDCRQAHLVLLHADLLLRERRLQDWQVNDLAQLIAGVTKPQWRALIRFTLNTATQQAQQELLTLVRLCPASVLPVLLEMLSESLFESKRPLLSAALLAVGRTEPERLRQTLEEMPALCTREVMHLLGELGEKRLLPYLETALAHRNPKIRREAMTALGALGGMHVIRLLTRMLDDADEGIRCLAMDLLGRQAVDGAVDKLLALVQSRSLTDRTPAELEALFAAIGHCGGNRALEALAPLVRSHGFFSRGKTPLIRDCATRALAAIGTSEARAILDRSQRSIFTLLRHPVLQPPGQRATGKPAGADHG